MDTTINFAAEAYLFKYKLRPYRKAANLTICKQIIRSYGLYPILYLIPVCRLKYKSEVFAKQISTIDNIRLKARFSDYLLHKLTTKYKLQRFHKMQIKRCLNSYQN